MKLFNCFLIPLIITTITGCSAIDKTNKDLPALIPMESQYNSKIIRMDDGYVKQAIHDYLKYKNSPLFSQYNFTRIDLNNDGLKDAIAYIETPYGYWCNKNGCTILIMKALKEGFSIVGNIRSVRPPFKIEKNRTNGWNDIKMSNARLRFDERQYIIDDKIF